MEHRWRKRLQKTIKVMLYHNRVPVISCKTRDIGIEGIFVESGPLEFRNYTCLEIEFEGAYCRRDIAGKAIHSSMVSIVCGSGALFKRWPWIAHIG